MPDCRAEFDPVNVLAKPAIHAIIVAVACTHSDKRIRQEWGMRGKSIVISAVIALAVVVGYDYYKSRRA